MKKVLFYVLVMFSFVNIFAQEQPVVAVAPFDVISGMSETEANMISRVFYIRLGNTQKVTLVDRTVVDRVIREHNFQSGDWSDQEKTAELGKALNTDWIVRGDMEKFGATILVTVSFYDIQTFQFKGGADLRLANADEAYDKIDPLVNKLIETIAGRPSQPQQPAQQGGNAGASAYYGTWVSRYNDNDTRTLIIESNRITMRDSIANNYIVISNCTWTVVNNTSSETGAIDCPKGFKVFGTVTDNRGFMAQMLMPLYLFSHKSDNNRLYLYASPDSNSEMQQNTPDTGTHFSKVQ